MAARVPSPTDDARNLQAIMLRAMRRASSVVADPPGRTDRARKLAAARAAATMRDLRRDLSAMNAQANAILGRQLPAQFARGVRRADRLAKEAGLVRDDTPIGGALTGAETRRAAVLVRTKQADLNKAFASIGSDNGIIGRAVRQARAIGLDQATLRRILAGGAISGTGAQDLQQVRELMRSIGDGKIVEVVNKHGVVMEFDAQSYADMVYQTAMAEAANIAEVERLAARGNFYVEIIGSNSKNFCTAYVGRVFYTGDGEDPLGHFPSIRRVPRGGAPFHPRCSKRYVPFNPRTATPSQIQAAKPTPEVERLLDKSSNEAQRTFETQQEAKKIAPTPVTAQPPHAETAKSNPTAGMSNIETSTAVATPSPVLLADRIVLPAPPLSSSEHYVVSAFDELLGDVSRLHRLPATAAMVPVRVDVSLKPNGRILVENEGRRPVALLMRPGNLTVRATVAHEFGHLFEIAATGQSGGAHRSDAFEKWRDAYRTTPTYATLWRQAARTRQQHLVYLASPIEVFARSYAQWLAERSGNAMLRAELAATQWSLVLPTQWPDAEFGPIGAAFDAAVDGLGLQP